MDLGVLLEMSHRYGADEDYVLEGGGNTSVKENGVLYVKGSGTHLSNITMEQFVAMDLERLWGMLELPPVQDLSDEERDARTLSAMMAARLPGEGAKRPSVEAALHALFPYRYVLHVHPPLINGLTCGADGEASCGLLFGDRAVWIGLTQPGFALAQTCKGAFARHKKKTGAHPRIVLMENHGVFAAADTVAGIDSIMEHVAEAIRGCVAEEPDFGEAAFDMELASSIERTVRMLYAGDGGTASAIFCTNKQVCEFVAGAEAFRPLTRLFLPDHILYCMDEPLFIGTEADIAVGFSDYAARKGFLPRIVAVRGLGFFALGSNEKTARQAKMLFLDAIKVAVYARAFGGARPLPDWFVKSISNSEAGRYRMRISQES